MCIRDRSTTRPGAKCFKITNSRRGSLRFQWWSSSLVSPLSSRQKTTLRPHPPTMMGGIELSTKWAEESSALDELLGFEKKPVAVTFTNEEPDVPRPKKMYICRAMKIAGEGRSSLIDIENSGCGGGSFHCGLTAPPQCKPRRTLQNYLTKGEKLTASVTSFLRMEELGSPPPTGLSERIFIGPLEDAPIRPDLVLFMCNAEQACRILTLDIYWDGIPARPEVSGSMCHSAIAYPLVTGRTNLTLGDWTARRAQGYDSGIVFVTVPYERMH